MATRSGLSKWITGEKARADVHRWRRYFPAIAVGAGTVLSDDPELTARLPGEEVECPLRFVFDRNLVTFKESLARVYTDEWRDQTIVVSSKERAGEARRLEAKHGIRFWCLSEGQTDLSFTEFADRCREESLLGLYVEGGAHLLSSFLGARALHYLFAYRAPKLLADTSGLHPFMGKEPASMEDTIRLREVRHETFGDDQLVRGFLHYPESEDDLDGNLSR
jgi:diaminohydroxyphosphoribosylaminopyrimidine deaminase/5-amino-6-(5-phosphoribosylamino)uracil reductase